ncbi:hypothetical protein CA11_40450 [Gimesia maris]|nr:hypothetical protein CA11_40450 [Gimesia maris]
MFIEYTKMILMMNASLGCLFWALRLAESYLAAVLCIAFLWIAFILFTNTLSRSQNMKFNIMVLFLLCLTCFFSDPAGFFSFRYGPFSAPTVAVMILTLILFDLLKLEPVNQ